MHFENIFKDTLFNTFYIDDMLAYINEYTQESETMYNSSPAPIIQSENYVQRQFPPNIQEK